MSGPAWGPPLPIRFWGKVLLGDDCWLWQAKISTSGYGRFGRGRRSEGQAQAHRMAWELCYGPIPDGLSVLHRCDVRRCVRPDHLFLGTQRDNLEDAWSKGRLGRGDQHNRVKTQCAQGHPFDAANTSHINGQRVCKACRRESTRRYRERKKGQSSVVDDVTATINGREP